MSCQYRQQISIHIVFEKQKKKLYFSSMWERIFLSFCMMLLVSLPETEGEGEGLRISLAYLTVEAAASDAGISETGVSWKIQKLTQKTQLMPRPRM